MTNKIDALQRLMILEATCQSNKICLVIPDQRHVVGNLKRHEFVRLSHAFDKGFDREGAPFWAVFPPLAIARSSQSEALEPW
jgi:hypothetical protein